MVNGQFRITILLVAISFATASAHAASAGSKNKEGNRLFDQGKYEDALKAYLEAQAEIPDRPEILYNLGNTFIRQKKYEQAMQSLRQAGSKGDKSLQARSWFNSGNALYEMGNFKESSQAYIQSLRINPGDREAKHNLELTLKKMQQQQQKNQQNKGQNQKEQDEKSRSSEQNQQAGTKDARAQPEKGKQQPESPAQPEPDKPVDPRSTEADRRAGSFSKERALQILDALQNQELAEQRKLLERRARRKATGRDW